MDSHFLHQGKQALYIDARGREQLLAQRFATFLQIELQPLRRDVEHLAHKGKPVGMYAGGGNADERVSGLHLRAVNELCFIRHADAEARKVIFLFGIKAGHLRRFAADQRAPRLHTALGHARHDLLHALGHIFAHRNIVQKKQRLCTRAGHIVCAHGHTVDAHGIVLIHHKGELQLGAHAIRPGDEHRLLHAGQVRLKQAAEAADAGYNARRLRARHMLFHQFHRFVTGGYIYTRLAVAVGITVIHRMNPSFLSQQTPLCQKYPFTSAA